MPKELIVVGDRVLILPDEDQDRTDTGLYLPQGVKEKEKVQSGRIVKTGPGYPIVDPNILGAEPWQAHKSENKYFPLQAKEGDHCIFLKNDGIEIEFEKKKYIIVPHSAILALLRNSDFNMFPDLA
jgi:co-chaperonin GroES (HSP10)